MRLRRAHRFVAIEIAVRVRECAETPQGRVDEAHAAAQRAALEVVIRRGELNQTLKILFEVRFSGEPELLPRLVRVPEFGGIEVLDAAEEMRGKVGFRPSLPRACRAGASRRAQR